jgi:uncharacterized protein (UPF0548 family)
MKLEDNMKHHWQIRRQSVGYPDGQRRWDRAYQLLLGWNQDTTQKVSVQQETVPEAQDPNPGLRVKEQKDE